MTSSVVRRNLVTTSAPVPAAPIAVVPALVGDAGTNASGRYVEFFTANVNNPHTRRKLAWQEAPLAAWAKEVKDRVDDGAQMCCARTSTGQGCGKVRLDNGPCPIVQISVV
jgi:hypothetical protein